MKYGYLLLRGFSPFINLAVDIANIFLRRNKRIILFGAWMGQKYADNTRFLYEYLQENKDEYVIDKLIWVTRDHNTFQFLKSQRHEVYMMHDPKSFYYHIKAGVHIVCNLGFSVENYSGDLMGQFSGHAIKINTWHGVPMKAGKSTGENQRKQGSWGKIKYKLRHNRFFYGVFTPGHWDQAYYLSTGKEATKRCSEFCGFPAEQFIECGYPRNCTAVILHDDEKKVIGRLGEYSNTILYVPTFRDKWEVPHPLTSPQLRDYLDKTNTLWIEKPHAATKVTSDVGLENEGALFLDSSFDLNAIIPYVSIVITDYSSVCYDAMNFRKPVLFYIPDYEKYLINDRGFLFDFRSMVIDLEATDVDQLIKRLEDLKNNSEYSSEVMHKEELIMAPILSNQHKNIGEIISMLSARINAMQREETTV